MKFSRGLSLILALLLLFVVPGCNRSEPSSSISSESSSLSSVSEELPPPDYPVQVYDQEIARQPRRVVSLSPALTEMLCAFGYEDRLFGVSVQCDYPDSVYGMTSCGSSLNPDIQQIQSLSPDLVLTQTPLQQEDYWKLADQGIPVLELPSPSSLEQLFQLYANLCLLMDGENTGRQLGNLLSQGYWQRLETLAERVSQELPLGSTPGILVIDPEAPILGEGESLCGQLLSYLGVELLTLQQLEEQAPALIFSPMDIPAEQLAQSALFQETLSSAQVIPFPLVLFERCSPRVFDELDAIAQDIYAD